MSSVRIERHQEVKPPEQQISNRTTNRVYVF